MKHSVYLRRLSFGSPVYFINIPNDPLLNFKIYINSWYRYSPESKYEISHLLEHCLFEKNKLFNSPIEFKTHVEKLWVSRNGFTDFFNNYYIINWEISKYKDIISLLINLVNWAELTEEIYNQQKEVVRNEITANKNDFLRELNVTLFWKMFDWNLNYKKRCELLDNIWFADIKNFYKEYYVPQNYNFIISWDIVWKEDDILNIFEEYYNSIEQGLEKKKDYEISNKYIHHCEFIEVQERSNYEFRLRYVIETQDEYLRNISRFFLNILMKGSWSRMQSKAREQGLIYSLLDCGEVGSKYIALWFGEKISEEKLIPLLKLMIDEIKDILLWNVTDEEIDRAKGFFRGNVLRSHQTWGDVLNYYIDKLILKKKWNDLDEFVNCMEDFNREHLIEFSKYFDLNKWVLGIIWKNAEQKSEEVKKFLLEYSRD